MSSPSTPPLPPGKTGLPGLGETLSFLRDPYAFVHDRAKEHGPVFKTSLFGNATAVVVGPEAAERFIDPALVERKGSQPAPVFRLFAGPSVPHLDGDAHRRRKAILLQAFTREALAAYLPGTRALIDDALARWAARPEVRVASEAKRLALHAVAQDILGVSAPDDLARLDALYADVAVAFTGLPVALPWTKYARGLRAVDALLAYYRGIVRERRERPAGDGLTRILAASSPDGTRLSDDDAARELHHIVIAGRVVYAHLVTLTIEMARRQEVTARLREEIARVAPDGDLTVERLHAMADLTALVLEVKRTSPVVPGIFGRVRADVLLGGFRIPKGWTVLFGLRESLVDGHTFARPDRFEPDRFDPPRLEHTRHEHAFVPHGPGAPATTHHCAGTDYASQVTKLFAIALARHRVDLVSPDVEYDWSQLTPDPKDGLRARLT